MKLKGFFTERIDNIRALEKVYVYRRLAVAVVLVALLLGFGLYRYLFDDPYEQLAMSIEEEFLFVDVINVDRNCIDADCNTSFMFLLFYQLFPPGEDPYNQFIFRSLNGLYELSGDTDMDLVVGIVMLDTTVIGPQVTCDVREYFTIESMGDNCLLDQTRTLPIKEKWVGR